MASISPRTPATKLAHVVLLPFPAQGHISPFLPIADCLAASGIVVTFVQPLGGLVPVGAQQAPPKIAHSHASPIRTVTIPSGFDHSQPFSRKMMVDAIQAMRISFTELLEKLLLEENPPTCIIVDMFFDWGGAVARQFGLSQTVLFASSASVLSMGSAVPQLVAGGFVPPTGDGALDKTVDFIPGFSSFRIGDLPSSMQAEDGLEGNTHKFFIDVFDNIMAADRVLVNTVYELEDPVIDALRAVKQLRLDAVGPLHMMNIKPEPSVGHTQEDSSCLQWLDQQQQASVLYIAFGSVAILEDNAMSELAHAVEGSGESFLWVIRPDSYKGKASAEDLLPEGFMERTRDRGLVISWAPQLAVLGHPSVGAFLTHCGWNSILESLSNGVPMLGFPQRAEQSTNLNLLLQWQVGSALVRDDKVERSSMQAAITAIMRDEGLQQRGIAHNWKETFGRAIQGSSKAGFQNLLDDLKSGKDSSGRGMMTK